MAFLCVYVNQGALDSDGSGFNTYVAVRVGDQCVYTQAVKGAAPLWDREFILETGPLSQYVSIELWQKKLFSQQLFGQIKVSLLEIGHRNKRGEGTWYRFWQQLQDGKRRSTKHQVQLDIHFELPSGLSSSEAEQLEEKLSLLNQILEDEMLILREQAERIQREQEFPPPSPQPSRPPVGIDQSQSSHGDTTSMQYSDDSFNRDGSLVCSSEFSTPKPTVAGTQRNRVQVSVSSGDSFNRDGSLSPFPRVTETRASPKAVPDLHDAPPKVQTHQQALLHEHHREQGLEAISETVDGSVVSDTPQSPDDRPLPEGDQGGNLLSPGGTDGLPQTPVGQRAMKLWHRAVETANKVIRGADNFDELIESMPHLHLFMRKGGETGTRTKLADVVLNATRESKKIFDEIESSPDVAMRKRVHALSHAKSLRQLVNRQASALSIRKGLVYTPGSSELLKNEELKHLVYRKTLQALIYPISETQAHNFGVFSAKTPAYCFECEGLLWGIARQGFKCAECGVKCHKRCMSLINADCLMRRAEKSKKHKDEDRVHHAREMMKERMSARQWNHKEVFDHVREVFQIPDKIHRQHLKEARDAILDGSSKWSAKITVTVVEAHGLAAKDKDTATSDPYVTIKVGGSRKRTKTIPRELNPVWKETFEFESRESSDRVKVRVWDQDDDLASKIAGKLIREPDDFLGQVLIDVKSLSGELDVWYNLEGRTGKSAVSGAIRLRILTIIEGEETHAPYFHQYSCLHENLFHYEYQKFGDILINAEVEETKSGESKEQRESWMTFFREPAQEISNEFATRFGVEDIARAMTHFKSLVKVYSNPRVPRVMSDILAHVNEYFRDLTTVSTEGRPRVMSGGHRTAPGQPAISYKLSAAQFGRAEFGKTIELLNSQLKIDLSNYRETFPSSDAQRMEDLTYSVNLLTSICYFRLKVLDFADTEKSLDTIRECVQVSVRQTYQMLKQEVLRDEMMFHESAWEGTDTEGNKSPVAAAVPRLSFPDEIEKPTKMFEQLLQLMVTVVEDDKVHYSPCFSGLGNFTLWHITAFEIWQLFEEELSSMLKAVESTDERDASKSPEVTTTDAMNLLFKVKYVFKLYIAETPEYKDAIPEYPSMFRPFVLRWFAENDQLQAEYVVGALQSDRDSGFKPTSQYHRYSPSVVDVFCSLTEMYKILNNLECPDPELLDLYMAQFAGIIAGVLTRYTDIVKRQFVALCQNNRRGAVLLNNVVEIRELLKKLFLNMGGDKLGERAVAIIQTLQSDRLAGDLDYFCATFARSLDGTLEASVKIMKEKLLKMKNVGNTATDAETNDVIYAVMQTLSEWLQGVQAVCETTGLKKLMKELWQLLLEKLEKLIILPHMPENLDMSKMETLDLTEKQSDVLESSLEVFKAFFHGHEGDGLKMSFFDKSPELGRLRSALELYRYSSDTLIVTFMKTEKNAAKCQERVAHVQPVGYVTLQVSLFSPGDGENRLTVKVVSASDLRWPMKGVFRPYVEVNVLGPYLSAQRRRHSTNLRSGTTSPTYNETFHFNLGGLAEPEQYELHVIVKDYCFARSDRVVGIAVLQLDQVVDLGSLWRHLPLSRCLHISEMGRAILGILYGRSQDEVVREFVQIKSTRREVELETQSSR